MQVRAMSAVTEGLARYRITVPERPGSYAVLEIPAEAEDPTGLVELFAGTHLHLLEWSIEADGTDDEPAAQSPSESHPDSPPSERHVVATG